MTANYAAPAPLRLFGPPMYVGEAGSPVLFLPERRFVLLGYLACRRDWVTRDELAALFWPERPQAAARSNLRKVLLSVQQIGGGLPSLEQQGDRLRWTPDSDLQRFDAACAERRDAEALAASSAQLLQGLDAGLSTAAAAWLDFERDRAARQWREAATRRLAGLSTEPAAAAALAEELLQRDPFDEPALEYLCRACIELEQPTRGLNALRMHRARLAEAFGLEPSAALRALDAHLRRPLATPTPTPTPNRAYALGQAPAASPGFVGRRMELGQVRQLLHQPACRVLTITGPGGVGKSSLARAAFSAADWEPDAWWVALGDLNDVAQLPGRIASAIGVDLVGGTDPWQQIHTAIGQRSALLVLDNSEHLAELAPAVAALLATCSMVKLLNVSRSRLLLDGEWLLPLTGLPLPDADEVDPDVLRRNDAVRLFEARAMAAAPAFDLAKHAADVVRLVHAVDGLPLAIELSAPWARLLPVREIVAELSSSLDLLEPVDGQPRPARDRSLRASFEHSWQMLTPSERDSLIQLAQLPGPFGRDMAQQVTLSPLPVLAALVDKSLLRVEPEGGRFSLHPLIRQCADEKAIVGATDVPAVKARHAAHVDRWLARYESKQKLQAHASLAEIEEAMPHARQAWQWAIDHHDPLIARRCAQVLGEFYRVRGLWSEGLAALSHAATALDDTTPQRMQAKAVTVRMLALLQFHSGNAIAAEASARSALRLATHVGDSATIVSSLLDLGNSLFDRGMVPEARPVFAQALKRARRDNDVNLIAVACNCLGTVDQQLGDYDSALTHFSDAAVAMRRSRSNPDGLAAALNNIGNVHYARRQWSTALAMFEEGLAVCEAHGLLSSRPFGLINIGLTTFEMGRHDEAARWFERALAESRSHGEPVIEAVSLNGQALLAVARSRGADARARLNEALAVANRLEAPALQLTCIPTWAQLLASEGDAGQAACTLLWILRQPELSADDRGSVELKLSQLQLSDAELSEHGQRSPADGTVQGVVALIMRETSLRTRGH